MAKDHLTAAERAYSPLYFLASLGAGGLSVTFFMYLMFWVPHVGRPVPIFEDVMAYLATATPIAQAAVIVGVAGIAIMTLIHFTMLIWNFRQFSTYRQSAAFAALRTSNAETQLMAIPLTLAMSVNASFIVGLVFVPGLWNVVEYLFPLALIAFVAIGVYAFMLLGRFLARVMGEGGFDMAANNSFAQLMPTFAISMVAVGTAAPAAMSLTPWVVGLSLAVSTFLMVTAIILAVIATVLAISSMMQNGTAPEAAPTLMVIVPIVTVLGIAWMRQSHGLHVTLDDHATAAATFMFLTKALAIQIVFGLFGLLVLRRQGYAAKFLAQDGTRSAGSYALVCPGVAGSVMIHFWVNKGLVATGLIAKFGVAYWAFTLPAIALQFGMIYLVWKLHRLHFSGRPTAANAVPAE
jgi:hypothetical protein